MTKRIDELVDTICGAPDHPLAPSLREWCGASRPFLEFAETHATKIRKKARLGVSNDTTDDLLAELAVAALLARDRRFGLRYEPYHAAGQRGPDFEVTVKGHSALHVEVTRLRLASLAEGDLAGAARKLARVICDKIGQFPPGAMNMLVATVPPSAASQALAPAATRLLDSAPQHEPDLRADDVRAFLRQRQRLSAIAVCSFAADWAPLSVQLWRNPQAKHPLHPDVAKVLGQAGAG